MSSTQAEFVDYRKDKTQGKIYWALHWKGGFLVKCINPPHPTWQSAQQAAVAYASEHHLHFAGEGPSFG